jgi:succinate dehydrogenase/fumarate reductase cytochrome b subunit
VVAVQQPKTLTQPVPSRTAISVADNWLSPGRFALVLGALVLAAFPQVLLGLETFVVRDYGFFAFPLAHYQRECFWHGRLPFWDPYNNCGVPFLAQ